MTLLEYLTIIENDYNTTVFEDILEIKFSPDFYEFVLYEQNNNAYSIIKRYWWQLMFLETDQEFHFFGYYTNYSIPELLIPFSFSSFQNGLFKYSLLQDLQYMMDMLKQIKLFYSLLFLIHGIFKIAIDLALLGISLVSRTIATLCYITHYCLSSENCESLITVSLNSPA